MANKFDTQPCFTCPKCGRVSYNPFDVQYGYCAACHQETGLKKGTLKVQTIEDRDLGDGWRPGHEG